QVRELVGYATNMLNSDTELSTLLALQAVDITYSVDGTVLPEADTMLHLAVQTLRTPLRIPAATFSNADNLYFGYNSDGTHIMYPFQFSITSGAQSLTGISDPITG